MCYRPQPSTDQINSRVEDFVDMADVPKVVYSTTFDPTGDCL